MMLKQLLRLVTISSAVYLVAGCSIVDRKKTSGLQDMAVWKAESERLAQSQSADEEKYNEARDQIAGYIDGPLEAEIDDVAGRWIGTIDLSRECVPPNVVTAVDDFKQSAGRPIRVISRDTVLVDILDWIKEALRESRQASANALKAKLQELKWKDWDSVHNGH